MWVGLIDVYVGRKSVMYLFEFDSCKEIERKQIECERKSGIQIYRDRYKDRQRVRVRERKKMEIKREKKMMQRKK